MTRRVLAWKLNKYILNAKKITDFGSKIEYTSKMQ